MSTAAVIAGNNLAALVAGLALAESGRDVVMINPSTAWGGHFAGLELDGRQFDPGMVLYEFDAFNSKANPDLHSYDPGRRNDCGRFARLIADYVQARVDMREIPVPVMLHRGRIHPDMIIANRVDALAGFDPDEQARIRSELASICAAQPDWRHAANKSLDRRFANAGYTDISLANHGPTLHHGLFDPLCRKIMGVSPERIAALYHRAAWLPLYYPETLLSQFDSRPQTLPATRFHYPASGGSGALVRSLTAQLRLQPRIRIVQDGIVSITRHATSRDLLIGLQSGGKLQCEHFAWTLDPGGLIAIADPAAPRARFERAAIGLCFIVLPATQLVAEFSTLFVTNPDRRLYRVTNQEHCAGDSPQALRLVAEFRPFASDGTPLPQGKALKTLLLEELCELGLIRDAQAVAYCAVRILDQAVMIPNDGNRELFQHQLDWLAERMPTAQLSGASAAFHAASMNDQIVQGLKLAQEWAP